jgi:hypothetical protein
MAKLTKRSIDAFRYRGGWDVRWDNDIPGFGVRVYPSGKKSFVLSYRNAWGKKRLLVLVRYPVELKRELLEEWADHVAQEVQPKGAVLLS